VVRDHKVYKVFKDLWVILLKDRAVEVEMPTKDQRDL
jgi:hypothetical protein